MRVLLTTIPAYGHLHPLVPLARALQARGHAVAVATAADFAPAVTAAGLAAVPAGLPEREMAASARRGVELFADELAPAMVRDLLARGEQPDLVVHEEGEWGGPVVAAVQGVPSVAVGWGAPMWTREELRLVDAAVRPLWATYGVSPRTPAGLFDHLYLDTCPPLLQTGDAVRIDASRRMRFETLEPAVPAASAGEPQVYVTLGTVPAFNRDPELLAVIVDALSSEPVRVLLTVGPGNALPSPGGHPRLQIEPYVPQAAALAGSVLAITHGGAGSTLGALSFGLPVLVLPRGAPSQRRMAAACVAAGVGIALEDGEVDAGAVRGAVRRLLEDPAYRPRAEAVRDEIARLPPPADAAVWLERLAKSKGAGPGSPP